MHDVRTSQCRQLPVKQLTLTDPDPDLLFYMEIVSSQIASPEKPSCPDALSNCSLAFPNWGKCPKAPAYQRRLCPREVALKPAEAEGRRSDAGTTEEHIRMERGARGLQPNRPIQKLGFYHGSRSSDSAGACACLCVGGKETGHSLSRLQSTSEDGVRCTYEGPGQITRHFR